MKAPRPLLFMSCVLALALMVFAPSVGATPARAIPLTISRDNTYVVRDGLGLRYDLYRPRRSGRFPLVLLIHGGGWWAGARQDMTSSRPIAAALARRGYAAVAVDYRLACGTRMSPRTMLGVNYTTDEPRCANGDVYLPDQLDDIATAIRHVRSHAAALHVDPYRMGLLGASAGGHLALMTALSGATDLQFDAVVNWSGAPSTGFIARQSLAARPRNLHASFANAVGCDRTGCAETWQSYSPLDLVSEYLPQFSVLGVAGTNETQVPITRIRQFHRRLSDIGWTSQALAGPGDCHGIACADRRVVGSRQTVLDASIAFLDRELRDVR